MQYYIVKLNTARNCLRYIVRAFDIKEIYIPYYLCPAIRIALSRENCKINFYHIDRNFDLLGSLPENAYILYPDYFGVCSHIVDKLAAKYKNLIVDNAHAFFSPPKGIACFNSVRKFFPELRNGAFLYTAKLYNGNIKKDEYFYKPVPMEFKDICRNELMLDNQDILLMSDCTSKYADKLNYEAKKQELVSSFNFFNKELSDKNVLKPFVSKNSVPFKYPYLANSQIEADIAVKKYEYTGRTVFRYWHNMPDSFPEKIFYTKLAAF